MAGFALGFLVFFKKRKEEVEELLNMTYGERLKYLRNLRHMTQADLGLSCGFMNRGDVRIAQYESKKRYPREEVNIKLA